MNYEYIREFIAKVPTYKFARLIGVHPSTIFRIKQGKQPSPGVILRILETKPQGFEIERFLGEIK
ncbi:conserved hypothetical protein [Caldicellulosiruptor hydrothermalis 108]|uniref:HTH cro/C1-type domain-containing protein n=1 Tax=Caldicellulosiruptor hydrothermalis (strain DSM 18901 / VKM B-2411 / 108) TaxID=632292 RepID=E4QBF0_CALH1|nr:helix-turn-helix transcriptional regulator [Caldicellulosiruptor hydrothermalis]ADQ06052.1 conserved hypothetical protein [Caldicellulosiruptor hydrothermalis 108]